MVRQSMLDDGEGDIADLTTSTLTDRGYVQECNTTLKQLSNKYAALRETKEEMEAKASEIEKQIAGVQSELVKAMQKAGMKSFKTARGTFIQECRVSIKLIDQALAFQWLRDTGNDSIIKETVHHGTLAKTVREYCEAGEMDMAQVDKIGMAASLFETIKMRKV